jgi:hypothetical protein
MAEDIGNPFDDANFVSGGGLWDGKIVTVLSAKAKVDLFTEVGGKPWIDPKTGKQGFANVLEIVGIAEDTEAERRETYSAGSLIPTVDGEGFVKPDGTPGRFHENSQVAHFSKGLKEGKFDMALLWNPETQRMQLSKLTGARLLMKGVDSKDKDGKVKVSEKGYTQQKFYPVKFEGWKAGVQAVAPPNPGALRDKAQDVVLTLLAEAGGKIGRADLVRGIGAKMNGDPDVNKIIALVAQEAFHKDAPWVKDGTGFSLPA